MMRWRRSWTLASATFLLLLLVKVLILSPPSVPAKSHIPHVVPTWTTPPTAPPQNPLPFNSNSGHPIEHLVRDAQQEFQRSTKNQSKTIGEAVIEYRRRYGLNPPPMFDKWYHFAMRRDVQLIDDYDNLMATLLPFWALEPSKIRARVREALGYGQNGLIALLIRNGKPVKIEGGPEWQQSVTLDMIEDFAHLLPDMDIAFNVHDEPRVVVPHDELSRMVAYAKDISMPAALKAASPLNAFSSPPADLDDATRRIKEAKSSRFNEFPHQHVWVPSRLSCSPDSPARDYRENAHDETSSYALGELGFIYNHTASSDICNTPSLRETFGFFQRPNAFKIAHELIPIFSQSKVSSFQDIVYPSPWYHYGKTVTDKLPETHQVQYNSSMDMDWTMKNTTFWWRGSTTGGFSRDGGWKRQHRQIFVQRISASTNASVLENRGTVESPNWERRTVLRSKYKDLIDIHFSGVGQCDPGDCDAQREFFDMAIPVDPQQAWSYKYLLDIDGNAFSGRYYSFLRSQSLPMKAAIFREWHDEWLKPWVHYIPLSFRGEEHLETIRFLAEEEEGKRIAPQIAKQGRDWAEQVLRNVDLEVWLFRLLLEYGRVIDDNRASIGFVL